MRTWVLAALLPLVPQLYAASNVNASVQFNVTADWGEEFDGQITVTNNGTDPIRDWTLEFDFAPEILLIWDARVVSHSGSHYVIQSAGWNNQIAPGGSVVFGFGGAPGNLTDVPQNAVVTGTVAPSLPPVTPFAVAVQIAESAAWDTGFSAIIQLTNTTTNAIPNWQLRIDSSQAITSILALSWSRQDTTYTISNLGSALPPGVPVAIPIQASGKMSEQTFSNCSINGAPCNITVKLAQQSTPVQPAANDSILIGNLDNDTPALQFSIGQTAAAFPLSLASQSTAAFTVTVSNPSVLSASIGNGNMLQLNGLAAGRSGMKLQDTLSGTVRYVGVRVRNADGSLPGMPSYLALGSVSEDTADHLSFLQSFGPGATNKRVDIRYIYLNGGPINGWDTWSNLPGGRAISYIRNSRQLGIIPFFVFYNIPDGGEGYVTDLTHVQSSSYMQAYFKNLKLALDVINQEAKDDLVGFILEPDFIGYLAQNANQPASSIAAMTNAAYSSGVLSAADPSFPDTVQGLVRAINYTIAKYAPQVYFGWQVNLWASPAGGWTTSVPSKGLIHKTDTVGVTAGRPLIYQEAAAITKYYLDAGAASYGAGFLSIDKYGLDAAGFEAAAAADPANSTWFWNNDHWQNYLTFVRAMHDTSKLPIVLWQLPVGHINGTHKADPYTVAGSFTDLPDTNAAYEDSAPTFFFGDSFDAGGARLAFFSQNAGADPGLAANGTMVTWGAHLADAAAAGVSVALFGAGVGASTTNIGNPPGDGYWWITSAQTYYNHPVPLASPAAGKLSPSDSR